METEAASVQGAQAPSPGAVFSQAGQRCGPRDRDSPLLTSLQGKQNLRLLEKNRSLACIHCTYFYTKSSGKNPFFVSDTFSHSTLFTFFKLGWLFFSRKKALTPKPKKSFRLCLDSALPTRGFGPHRSHSRPSADLFF